MKAQTAPPVIDVAVSQAMLHLFSSARAYHIFVRLAAQAQHDWQRTGLMGTWGIMMFGPMWAWWYRFLDSRLHVYSVTSIATKVAIAATVMSPVSNVMYFTFMTVGESLLKTVCLSVAVPT